jgi:hypothetical protein
MEQDSKGVDGSEAWVMMVMEKREKECIRAGVEEGQ